MMKEVKTTRDLVEEFRYTMRNYGWDIGMLREQINELKEQIKDLNERIESYEKNATTCNEPDVKVHTGRVITTICDT